MHLFRLQPWVEVVKRSCGWHRAKRSGIHDQMSCISLALTISEENVSGLSASCTFRLQMPKQFRHRKEREVRKEHPIQWRDMYKIHHHHHPPGGKKQKKTKPQNSNLVTGYLKRVSEISVTMKEHPPRAVKEPMWQTQEWCADETEHGAWKNRGTNQAEKKKEQTVRKGCKATQTVSYSMPEYKA